MKLHDYCIFCSDELQPFQKLLGRCNWCMGELSDEHKSDGPLMPDMHYSFMDDDAYETDEED